MALEASTTHELLGRVRARLGAFRPRTGYARRTLFRAVLFATFVAAVSLVGRAWALARLPQAVPLVADRVALEDTHTQRSAPTADSDRVAASPALSAIAGTRADHPIAPRGPEAMPTAEGLVNLNTATASELETLPYVGPKRAQAILALRTKIGRFKSVDDLLKVKGIGRGTLKRMRPRLTIGAT